MEVGTNLALLISGVFTLFERINTAYIVFYIKKRYGKECNFSKFLKYSAIHKLKPIHIKRQTEYVYICNGPRSVVYHQSESCRGLSNCSTKIEK